MASKNPGSQTNTKGHSMPQRLESHENLPHPSGAAGPAANKGIISDPSGTGPKSTPSLGQMPLDQVRRVRVLH